MQQTLFVTATGGTETTSGDFKIHTFTADGTFTVSQLAVAPANNKVLDYGVVAGGGAPAGSTVSTSGGGAGGFREGRNSPVDTYPRSSIGSSRFRL